METRQLRNPDKFVFKVPIPDSYIDAIKEDALSLQDRIMEPSIQYRKEQEEKRFKEKQSDQWLTAKLLIIGAVLGSLFTIFFEYILKK